MRYRLDKLVSRTNVKLKHKTHVEVLDCGNEEEERTVVPMMSNGWDWTRTLVEFSWTMLIWNPMPVGQPKEGAPTVVLPAAVETFCFNMILILGIICCRDQGNSA